MPGQFTGNAGWQVGYRWRDPVAGTVYDDPFEVVQDRRKITTYGVHSVAIGVVPIKISTKSFPTRFTVENLCQNQPLGSRGDVCGLAPFHVGQDYAAHIV